MENLNMYLVFLTIRPSCKKGQILHWLAEDKVYSSTFDNGNWLEEPISIWGHYYKWV
jgi:hypothetical protein